MPHAESHHAHIRLKKQVCGAEIQEIRFGFLSLYKPEFKEIKSRNFGLWEFMETVW